MNDEPLTAFQYRALYDAARAFLLTGARSPGGLHREEAQRFADMLAEMERKWEDKANERTEVTTRAR